MVRDAYPVSFSSSSWSSQSVFVPNHEDEDEDEDDDWETWLGSRAGWFFAKRLGREGNVSFGG